MRVIMYRIVFTKEGLIKFISHLDLTRLWEIAFRKSGLAVTMSQGYTPHPSISFGPPLPLGVESECEMLDFKTEKAYRPGEIRKALTGCLPDGIRITGITVIPARSESLFASLTKATYEIAFPEEWGPQAVAKVDAARAAETLVQEKMTRKGKKFRDIKPLITRMRWLSSGNDGYLLQCTVSVGNKENLNCFDMLATLLQWPEERIKGLNLRRTALR